MPCGDRRGERGAEAEVRGRRRPRRELQPLHVEPVDLLGDLAVGGARREAVAVAVGLVPGDEVVAELPVRAAVRQHGRRARTADLGGEDGVAGGLVRAVLVVAQRARPVDRVADARGTLDVDLLGDTDVRAEVPGPHGRARGRTVVQAQGVGLVVRHHRIAAPDVHGGGGVTGTREVPAVRGLLGGGRVGVVQGLGGGLAVHAGDLHGQVGVAPAARGDGDLAGGAGAGDRGVGGGRHGGPAALGHRDRERTGVRAALRDRHLHDRIPARPHRAGQVGRRQRQCRRPVTCRSGLASQTRDGEREHPTGNGERPAATGEKVVLHGDPFVGVMSTRRLGRPHQLPTARTRPRGEQVRARFTELGPPRASAP